MMKRNSNQRPFDPAKWPFFYGWMILVWGILGLLLSAPGQTTGVAAFTEPLLQALGISRMQLSGAYMVGTLASGLVLTPAGRLYDRWGARWMGGGACLALGCVLGLLSRAEEFFSAMPSEWAGLAVLALLFFLLRLSGQGILTMVSRNMIMKWFVRHRGLAAGLSGAAVAFGFSYAPTIFSGWIGRFEWDGAWARMGMVWAGLSVLLFLFFRDNPEACKLLPDGRDSSPQTKERAAEGISRTLKDAMGTSLFWVLSLTVSLHALLVTAITFHVESIFTGAGMTAKAGFAIFPPAALIALAINLVGGWLSDRVALRFLFAAHLLAMGGLIFALMSLKSGWPVPTMIGCSGLASGLFGVLMSVTWPTLYGRRHLGEISGLCMTMMVLASALGPMLFSGSLHVSGGYGLGLGGCLAVGAVLLAGLVFGRDHVDRSN